MRFDKKKKIIISKKNLLKSEKADFLEEEGEFEPQATPRVFWLVVVFFFFFLVLSFVRLENVVLEKLRLELGAKELAERDESKLILRNRKEKSTQQDCCFFCNLGNRRCLLKKQQNKFKYSAKK